MRMPKVGRVFLATCVGSLFILLLYFQSTSKPGKCVSQPNDCRCLFAWLSAVAATVGSLGTGWQSLASSTFVGRVSVVAFRLIVSPVNFINYPRPW